MQRKGGAKQGVIENYNVITAGTFTLINARAISPTILHRFQTLVQASNDNQGTVYVGGLGNQTIELPAGESITIPADPSLIYVRGNGQAVNWMCVG